MAASSSIAEFTLETELKTNRSGPVRWIASHARRQWHLILLALAAAAANGILAAVQPVLIGNAFNVIFDAEINIKLLSYIALIIGGTQLLRTLIMLARNWSFEITAQRVERDIRHEIFIRLLGKSMTFHSLQPVGDTMARATNDVREVNFLFNPGLNMVIGSANFLIAPLITLVMALVLSSV